MKSINGRIEAALSVLVAEKGLTPAAIYLTPNDYDALQRCETRRYRRATGSQAILWPCTVAAGDYELHILGEKLIEKLVPVRQRTGQLRLRSTVYATTGEGIPLDA